jgi:hypothetical protein
MDIDEMEILIDREPQRRIAHFAGQCGHAVVAKHIAIERIQLRVIDIGCKNAFTQVIENHDPRGSAQAPKRSFV